MADEDAGEKTSRKDRWKSALERTKTKLKDRSKKSDQDEFKLTDDVNDFLQAGRPSTSDSGVSRSEPPPDERLYYPGIDHESMVQAGLTNPGHGNSRSITPPRPMNPAQRSPRGIPIPKIDVTRSQRWPGQQEISDRRAEEMDEFLRPAQRPDQRSRSQSQGAIQGRRKGPRPRNLSVAFQEAPPVVIGEGGDEAEAPPTEIGRAKARARSVSPMPGSRMEGYPQQFRRKQVPPGAVPADHGSYMQGHYEPQRLARVQTGVQYPGSATSKSSAEMSEFELSLQAPTPVTTARGPPLPTWNQSLEMRPAHPSRIPPPPPPPPMDGPNEAEAAQLAPTNHGERHLRPALANQDLRMQFEEGQALRHSHYRGLSNSSIVDANVSPVSPDLRQTSIDDAEKHGGMVSERRVSEVSPLTPEESSGGWI